MQFDTVKHIKLSSIGLFLGILFGILGFTQPFVLHYLYTQEISFKFVLSATAALFFSLFIGVYYLLHYVLSKFESKPGSYTVGDLLYWVGSKQSPTLTAIARIGLSFSLLLISLKYSKLLYRDGLINQSDLPVNLFKFPKIIDRFVPFFDIGELTYQIVVVFVALLAIVGIRTRETFAILWIIAWYLVSHYEASSGSWSHGASPILMTSFPLLFHDLRGNFYLDNFRLSRTPVRSDFIHLYFCQIFAALFFFGAFFAKMYYGGIGWITSDHIRNAYHVSWASLTSSISQPIWIDWVLGHEILLFFSSIGHLVMQAIPLLVILFPFFKTHRVFEGSMYLLACILLWAFMGYIWPWYWWLPMALLFFDFDGNTGQAPTQNVHINLLGSSTWFGLKYLFVATYIFGFTTQIPAARADLFPFVDNLAFYALPYDTYPFDSKVAHIFPSNGITVDSDLCFANQDCVFENRVKQNDQNSPINQLLTNLTVDEKIKFLSWCVSKDNDFCPVGDKESMSIWSGFFNMDEPGLPLIYLGITALRDANGETLAVKYLESNDSVRFYGSLIDEIEAISILILNENRSAMLDQTISVNPGNGYVKLPETASCLIGAEVTLKDGRSFNMLAGKRCSWRSV